ncbi:hypothetical protein ACH3XW_40035 [Acanthocheilonema viteae]
MRDVSEEDGRFSCCDCASIGYIGTAREWALRGWECVTFVGFKLLVLLPLWIFSCLGAGRMKSVERRLAEYRRKQGAACDNNSKS